MSTSPRSPPVEKQPRALQEERSLPGLARTGQPAPGTSPTSSHGLCRQQQGEDRERVWSISDMLSPTLGRPQVLPWWPDQPRPAGLTPSCAVITRLPATLSLTLELPSGGKAATSSSIILPTSGIWTRRDVILVTVASFELYYSCTFLLRLARYQSASW